jgi:hypothetical protein
VQIEAPAPSTARRRSSANPPWLGVVSFFSLMLTVATVVATAMTVVRMVA